MRELLRLANRIDATHPDLADRMERLAQRQYRLPLEMRLDVADNQYSDTLGDIIDSDAVPEWSDPEDQGLYHVTTNLPAVLQNGLQSRRQLQRAKTSTQGLGGNMPGEDLEMVATTHSDNRAQMIEQDLKRTLGWVSGQTPTTEALEHWLAKIDDAFEQAGWDGNTEEDDPGGLLDQWKGIVWDLVGNLTNAGIEAEDLVPALVEDWQSALPELVRRIDAGQFGNRDRYDLVQNLEADVLHILRRAGLEDDQPTSGLAANWDDLGDIDPKNIGIVNLKARRNAPRQYYPREEQVNFYPSDLRIEHPDLLPHEGRTLQETMLDPNRHRPDSRHQT